MTLLAGCGRQDQPPAGAEGAGGRAADSTSTIAAPAWKMQLAAPENLPASKPVELTASIQDAAGQPVEGAEVEISLNMTTMKMGENISRLSQKEPGVYTGKAVFTMKGPWEVVLRASKGSERATKMFRYTVK